MALAELNLSFVAQIFANLFAKATNMQLGHVRRRRHENASYSRSGEWSYLG
ncbi:hypothetical protein CSUNSWCD_69 [Campylobacter showae CSUNSWCD]|uniref:Uncharacterized protein n=1 Tax=Campylobacter showae CSUNSWCD TaxID=1244083 RepID=M5IRI7_9BACT|nr:hypothetical protein CSUNSWCD_69 [Campylobacter showae CSUNSWCD]